MSPTTNLSVVSTNCQSGWLPAVPYIIHTGVGKRSLGAERSSEALMTAIREKGPTADQN